MLNPTPAGSVSGCTTKVAEFPFIGSGGCSNKPMGPTRHPANSHAMFKKKFLACFLAISLVVSLLGVNFTVSAAETGQNANIQSQWNTTAGTITQGSNGITFSGAGTGMIVQSFYENAFTSVNGFNVDINLDALGAETGSDFGIYLSSSASPSSDGIKLVFQPYASNDVLYAVNTFPYVGGAYKPVNNNYLEIMKNTGALNVRLAKDGDIWKLYINGAEKGVDLSSISGLLDSGNLFFGLYAWVGTPNNYSLRVNKINGYSAGTINVSNTSKWTTSTGTMTQNFNGLSFLGNGSGKIGRAHV